MAATWIGKVKVYRGKRSVGHALADSLNYGKDNEKTTIATATNYGLNYDKTADGVFISAYGCSPEMVDVEFEVAHEEYKRITGKERDKDVVLYHIRQSFKPRVVRWRGVGDDLESELQYKTHYTEQSAQEHMDELKQSGCSEISYEQGDKITPEKANELGLELVKRYTKNNHAYIVCTHVDKEHIHNHIYFHSVSLDRTRKHREPWNSNKIIRRISDRICLENGLSIIEEPQPNRGRDAWVQRDKRGLGLLIDLQNNIKAASSPGYAHWATLYNIKKMSEALLFMQENRLTTHEKLQNAVDEISSEFTQVKGQIDIIDDRQDAIKTLQKHMATYGKTKEIYTAYKKNNNSKSVYTRHESDIKKHIAAREYFDRLNLEKLPTVGELKKEYATLQTEKGKLYQEYHPLKKQMRDAQNAKRNVEILRNIEGAKPERHIKENEREI